MFLHKILVAALVVAPMALAPADAAAQERGSEQVQVAQSEAPAVAGEKAVPEGLQKSFEERTAPALLQRLFPGLFPQAAPAPAPAPEPAPEPAPAPEEECDTIFAEVDGEFVMVDCHGNVVG